MTAVLELIEVSCTFHDGGEEVAALDAVTFAVDRGEMVAVVGPSGSGKSTLVHVACGLVIPTSGQVCVDGHTSPARWPVMPAMTRRWWADRRRQTIGVVHQRLNLVPALSAVDNVALPLRLDGVARRPARAAAEASLAEVDAVDLAGSRVERLSMGQQQRVALARATVGDRPLVLADEPTAALDTVGAERIAELLSRLAANGRAVVLVTHDSRLASWADRAIVLRDGRVVDRIDPAAAEDAGTAVAR